MKKTFSDVVKTAPLLLTEGAVIERLRREYHLSLETESLHASFMLLSKYSHPYIGVCQPSLVIWLLWTDVALCMVEVRAFYIKRTLFILTASYEKR